MAGVKKAALACLLLCAAAVVLVQPTVAQTLDETVNADATGDRLTACGCNCYYVPAGIISVLC